MLLLVGQKDAFKLYLIIPVDGLHYSIQDFVWGEWEGMCFSCLAAFKNYSKSHVMRKTTILECYIYK